MEKLPLLKGEITMEFIVTFLLGLIGVVLVVVLVGGLIAIKAIGNIDIDIEYYG